MAATNTQPKTQLFTYVDGSSLWQVSASWLSTIPVWEGNRVMDEAHLADLTIAIANPQEIQGPFSVVEYISEDGSRQRKIVDGQHRRAVIARYFDGEGAEDFPVLVRRYVVADHTAVIAIFKQINHAKPMEYRGSPTERLHDIVAAMRREFICERAKGGIIAMVRTGCVRPALNIEHLEAAIKRYKLQDRTDLTPDDIIEHARKMNGLFAADPTGIPARCTAATLAKAEEYGFYLGLDPTCSWLGPLSL